MMFSCDFCFRKFFYQMMIIIIVNTYCALLMHQAWLHSLPRMNSSNPHNNPVIVLVTQSCPTLCNCIALQASLCMGLLQARILEWVAMASSRGPSQPRDQTQVSCISGRYFYHLSHQGSPRILDWVVYPFSWGSSQPRN